MSSSLAYYFAIFAFAIVSIDGAPADHKISPEKIKEAAVLLVNDCKNQEGATDADVAALSIPQLPESHEGLCMVQCLFNTAKIMKNGKLHKEGAVEFFTSSMKGDKEKIAKMKEMMDLCEKEIGDVADGCQVAKLFTECSAKHGKEYGINFSNKLKP